MVAQAKTAILAAPTFRNWARTGAWSRLVRGAGPLEAPPEGPVGGALPEARVCAVWLHLSKKNTFILGYDSKAKF